MKKSCRNIYSVLCLASLIIGPASAQIITPDAFLERLKSYTSVIHWEDSYLHTDRDIYTAGEDLWYSVYNFDRKTSFPGGESSLIYVELLDPEGIPLIRKRAGLVEGTGNSHILIPDTLSSGTYFLRAYTGWMKNFMPGGDFIKEIEIYNPFKNDVFRKGITVSSGSEIKPGTEFFPEGGKLHQGVRSRIAFRYTNSNGIPSRMNGIVINSKGDTITPISAGTLGYGSFFLVPAGNERYYCLTPAGRTELPAAENDGFGVELIRDNEKQIEVLISAAGRDTVMNGRKFLFVIMNRGNAHFLAELTIKDVFTRVIIPVTRLQPGVSVITLISEDKEIVFERSFWLPSSATPSETVNAGQVLERRRKVSPESGSSTLSELANSSKVLSVSVIPSKFDVNNLPLDEFMDFGTEFGRIPWFNKKEEYSGEMSELTDNFLISEKSRWIDLQKVINNDVPETRYPLEKDGHMMPVSIRYRDESISDTSEYIYMSTRGKVAEFNYAKRNDEGIYYFLLPSDNVARNYIIQPQRASTNMILEILSPFSAELPSISAVGETLDAEKTGLFSELSFNYQVSRVYGNNTRIAIDNENDRRSAGRRFYGIPELEIWLDDYIDLPVMQEVFFELVPGVIFRSVRSGYEVRIINPLTGRFYNEQPLVMIDGLIINDLSVVADLDPELVEKVEAVKTPYLIGDLIIQGIVNIITYSGRFSNVTMPDYAAEVPYRVLDTDVKFLSPDYSDPAKIKLRNPDLRNTLHWDPAVRKKSDNGSVIEFWTSDIPGFYTININGVGSDGNPVSYKGTFEVR